jgi:hypothetical protein
MPITAEESRAEMMARLADKDLAKQVAYIRDAAVYARMVRVLNETGRLLNLASMEYGNVPAHVDLDGRVRLFVPKNMEAAEHLYQWFTFDKSEEMLWKFSNYLTGSEHVPPCALHRAFHYNPEKHLLFINEFNRRYLRVDGQGNITRHVNGEDAIVFIEKEDSTHLTDIAAASAYAGGALDVDESSPWVRYVFDICHFEGAISQPVARTLLMGFLLSTVFKERVMTVPIIHLHSGMSGTLKTAMAQAIGWVLCGSGFKVTLTPNDRKECETVLICAPGFLVLDESNDIASLDDMLKSVVTGGCIQRRKLYTTGELVTFLIECVVILTTNRLSVSEDAVTQRILQFTTGRVEEFRSEFEVRETWCKLKLRDVLWTELVGRAAAAMREITAAEKTCDVHLRVDHRLSSFWVFLRMLSRQEGCEQKVMDAITGVKESQDTTMADQDDLTPLVEQFIAGIMYNGESWTAQKWCVMLKSHGEASHMSLGAGMSKLLSSSLALSNRFRASKALLQLGLESQTPKSKATKFRFPKPAAAEAKAMRRRRGVK